MLINVLKSNSKHVYDAVINLYSLITLNEPISSAQMYVVTSKFVLIGQPVAHFFLVNQNKSMLRLAMTISCDPLDALNGE